MSYSFSSQAPTKAELKAKVAEQLAAIVIAQPAHAADQPQAQAAADAFIDLLADDEGHDVYVSMYGSISISDAGVQQVNVNVTTNIVTPKA